MDNFAPGAATHFNVAIIGGGPAGLSAAIELKKRGVSRVAVLDREPHAGGIPRHCGHLAFGMREFKRILTGPDYARRLVQAAQDAGAEIYTVVTVAEARPGGELLIITERGTGKISADRIIYATGVRETPRSARLISGNRPQGIMNTGALQSMVYLKNRKPFNCPVIIGTELVSFSAIMTCRHARIRPVAMIEEAPQVTARWPSSLYPRFIGIPLLLDTHIAAIEGDAKVSAVVVQKADGRQRRIDCDGVLLTGKFTPEASLASCGHLAVDPGTGGPAVDQYGRCSDPAYFATGNILRPVETAGWSWSEGRQTGHWVAEDLAGHLPVEQNTLQIIAKSPQIRYVVPQKLVLPRTSWGMNSLQLRFTCSATGRLEVCNGAGVIKTQKLSVHPERRVLLSLKELSFEENGDRIELRFKEPLS
jgi:thioredoxin reductase